MGKKARAPVPVVNRRTLSRKEREDRFRRWLYVGAGVVAALIVGVLVTGLYQTLVAEPASPVATVNGTPIRTDSYQRWVQYQRYQIRSSLAWIQDQLAQLDPNDEAQQSLYSYFSEQQRQLQSQSMSLGPMALEDLIDAELVRQEAARRGLSVSPDEVQKEIEQQFGYNLEQPTPVPTPATASETITTTPEVTATESITATPEPTMTPAPTSTPMTLEEFNTRYNAMIQDLKKNAGISEGDYRGQVELSLLRSKLQEALGAEVPTVAEQIHARHIMLDNEEDAKAALERIRAGEDFVTVAQEVSTDTTTKDQGGDLGWFPRGSMMQEFEDAAFALQLGQVSEVVQTSYGYHIIKVEERDANRALDETMLAQKRSQALEDWLATQRNSDAVVRSWSSKKVPPDTLATQ